MSPHFQGKGLGWRKNAPGNYMQGHHLMAVRKTHNGLDNLAKPSLLEFRGTRIDQGGVGSCVAFATTRNMQLWCAANGYQKNFLPAPGPLYYNGRCEEFAGTDPTKVPPMQDTGTEPRLMMTAVQGLGFVPWSVSPYSDDLGYINTQPSPKIYDKSFAQRGLQWAIINEIGRTRLASVKQALRSRMPVSFGMQVDEAWMNNHGERVTKVNGLNLVGEHMMAVLAVLDEELIAQYKGVLGLPSNVQVDDVIVDNWWGLGTGDNGWGTKDGFGVISSDVFSSTWLYDFTIFEALPPTTPLLESPRK